jgi:very-short-patch-repair endonuclease
VAAGSEHGAGLPHVQLARERDGDELRRAVAEGRLTRVRRGAYTAAHEDESQGRAARRAALARIAAVHAQLTVPFVFSHESAALLWQLDTLRLSGRTHLVQASRPSTRNDPLVARHVGVLPAEECTVVAGLPVTTVARTVLDCLRTLRGDAALVVADSAARGGLDMAEVRSLMASARGARGIVAARRLAGWVDGGAATPGESMTRWALLDAGLPAPATQVAVPTRLGTFVIDMGWPERKVGVEFDGLVKYSGAYGRTGTEALFAEKRRQDALEEQGWRLLRVTWTDLRDPLTTAARAAAMLR